MINLSLKTRTQPLETSLIQWNSIKMVSQRFKSWIMEGFWGKLIWIIDGFTKDHLLNHHAIQVSTGTLSELSIQLDIIKWKLSRKRCCRILWSMMNLFNTTKQISYQIKKPVSSRETLHFNSIESSRKLIIRISSMLEPDI